MLSHKNIKSFLKYTQPVNFESDGCLCKIAKDT